MTGRRGESEWYPPNQPSDDYTKEIHTTSLKRKWISFRVCFSRRRSAIEMAVMVFVMVTTFVTWRGVLRLTAKNEVDNGAQSLSIADAPLNLIYDTLSECKTLNDSVEWGHSNPCWRIDGKLICAPKVVFLGFDGCYSEEMLSSLVLSTGILMINHPIDFGDLCPLDYLVKYDKLYQVMEGMDKKTEPQFYISDEDFLTNAFLATDSGDLYKQKVRSLLPRISRWFRSETRVGVFICDPVVRLLKYLNSVLIDDLEETTPEALHKYIVERILRAEKCIHQFGLERCQLLHPEQELLYNHLLTGIYRTYIQELYKFIPHQQVKLVHTDPLNDAAFSEAVNALANFLKVYVDQEKLEKASGHFRVRLEREEKLVKNLRSDTIKRLRQFYWKYRSDLIELLEKSGNSRPLNLS